MSMLYSLGIGIGTQNSKGEWLEVFYAQPLLAPPESVMQKVASILGYTAGNETITVPQSKLAALNQALGAHAIPGLEFTLRPVVATLLASDIAPASVPEVYLKLHLLSHRLVKPHATNLTGMFGLLPNVAWTSQGAIDIAELPARQLAARIAGRVLSVDSVDKFPKMTDYVVPTAVRVADTARVRLGAYLGEGTTIMHEGFVNFNAGTEGPGMIEGRISAGVFVDAHADLGGGCSTMGTLSGGNNVVISIGKKCLIGANAGVGIPLGDRNTIEAGLYVTAGSKVALLDAEGNVVQHIKARELAGQPDLLFRRNSQTGALECLTNKSAIELNHELHQHN